MRGTARVRSCSLCDKQVFNLSELTRAETEELILARAGKLCVRYFQRADGTILLADCTYHGQRGGWLPAIAAAATFGIAVVATPPAEDPIGVSEATMGFVVGGLDLPEEQPTGPVITVSAHGEIAYEGQLVATVAAVLADRDSSRMSDVLFERLEAAATTTVDWEPPRGERMVILRAHATTDARVVHEIFASAERAGYLVLFATQND